MHTFFVGRFVLFRCKRGGGLLFGDLRVSYGCLIIRNPHTGNEFILGMSSYIIPPREAHLILKGQMIAW